MKSILEVKSIGKKYNLGSNLPYLTLRDAIAKLKIFNRTPIKSFWALRQLSFSIQPGEVVGIIGPNGAGKSTLLKILSQITPPSTGIIKIRGSVASLLEVGTGFHPELTGRENIYLNGSILGMTRKQINEKLQAIVEFSGIEKFIDTPAKHYSTGMYTRLAFSVAAHLDSDIMLVDEVLAVGDAAFQKKSLAKMEEKSAQNGKTILFVSHDLNAVQKLCPKSILLDKGRLFYFGPTTLAISKYLQLIESITKTPIFKRKDVEGTKEVVIKSLEVLVSGKHTEDVPTGSDIEFLLEYQAKYPVKRINLAIGIDNALGKRITTLWTEFSPGKAFSITQNMLHGTFSCALHKLSLRPDTYHLNIYVEVEGKISFHLPYAATLHIVSGHYYPSTKYPTLSQGDVLFKHQWKHLK